MKVIVIGNGKVGSTIINQLYSEGHDITVIDKKMDKLEEINNSSDVLCINGDGLNPETLLEAGVKEADLVVAVTSSDELNIIISNISKSYGAKHVVSRVRSKEYRNQIKYIMRDLKIDLIINPEYRTAREISNQFRFIGDFKIEILSKGLVDIISFKLENNNKLINLQLLDIYKKYEIKMLVCAVERGEDVYIPGGNFTLQKGDTIYTVVPNKDISKVVDLLDSQEGKTGSVFIVGASKLSYYLCEQLIKMNIDIKVVDNDIKVCEEMAELFPQITIINADATNQNILEEEGLLDYDAFVALTGNDEVNIILSLYAKLKQIKKVVTKVNQSSYTQLIKELGLKNTLAPKDVISNTVLTYARSLEASSSISAETVHKLASGKVEVLEFIIPKEFKYINIALKDLKLQKDILIAGVVRNREYIMADGNTTLNLGDVVIVISSKKRLCKLEDIIG